MFRWLAVLITVVITGPAVLAAGDSRLTFESDILPILNAHCLQCHGGVHQKNELDLRTLAAVMKGGKSGTAVVPGKVDESLLWKKIAKDEMPKTDNKVSEANKKLIRSWIEAGAKGKAKTRDVDLARAALKPADVAKRIDREIDARLSAAKIPASPRGSDAEFLRRIYLDITGKPPTAALLAVRAATVTERFARNASIRSRLETISIAEESATNRLALSMRIACTTSFLASWCQRISDGRYFFINS